MTRILTIALAAVALAVLGAVPARAAEAPACKALKPFSAETHFLSVPGYLRWLEFQQSGGWISRVEAVLKVGENAVCTPASLLGGRAE